MDAVVCSSLMSLWLGGVRFPSLSCFFLPSFVFSLCLSLSFSSSLASEPLAPESFKLQRFELNSWDSVLGEATTRDQDFN